MMWSYVLGAGAIAGLMVGWAAVQAAWGKTFPEATTDDDVLAHRLGCLGCRCDDVCERGKISKREKMQ